MALPQLIEPVDTHVEEESHSYNPVYVDTNGNLYTITESLLASNNQPRAMKSTDGGETWSEMDAANRPGTDAGAIGDLESGWITQEPGFLTFSWQRSYTVWVRFRTSDHATNPDTWQMNTRNQVSSASGAPQFCSHTSPTDQNYSWVFASASSGSVYVPVTKSTGVEGTENTLDSSGTCPMAWLDADNVSHILYKSGSQLHHRTLTSGGTLSGGQRVDTNGVNAVAIPHCRPVPYTSGANDVVTCVFANGSGQLRAVDIVNGTPGSEQTITNNTVTLNPTNTGNDGAIISADVDGDTMHVFWSDSATGDLMHSQRDYGGSWSTPDTVDNTLTTGVWWLYAKTIEYPNSTRVVSLRYSDGFDITNELNDIWYNEYALSSGQSVNIGLATQTNTAQAVTAIQDKFINIGLATEVDAAHVLEDISELDEALAITVQYGGGTTVNLGLVTETDAAQTVARTKARAVTQPTEADVAQTVARGKQRAVAQATEVDTAQPTTTAKARAVAQVTESGVAQPGTQRKTYTTGSTSEADTAHAVGRVHTVTVGLANETDELPFTPSDVALPVTVQMGGEAIGLVVESDTAQPVTHTKTRAVGLATEADTAQPVTKVDAIHVGVGQPGETDTAQPVTVITAGQVGQAIEADTAQQVARRKATAVGITATTEQAQAVAHRKARAIGQVTEADAANPVVTQDVLGVAVEADSARTIAHTKARTVGQVVVVGVAQEVTTLKTYAAGLATGTDVARPITVVKARAVGVPTESATVLAVRVVKVRTVALATELSVALPTSRPVTEYVRPSASIGRAGSAGVRRGGGAKISSGTSGAELP